jgi:hypothetical protein
VTVLRDRDLAQAARTAAATNVAVKRTSRFADFRRQTEVMGSGSTETGEHEPRSRSGGTQSGGRSWDLTERLPYC